MGVHITFIADFYPKTEKAKSKAIYSPTHFREQYNRPGGVDGLETAG